MTGETRDIPADTARASIGRNKQGPAARGQIRTVLKMPVVWLQALIILLAYWLYIGTFEFPAFVEKVFDQTKLFGAQLGAFRDWLRPVAAIGAGLLADRIRPTRTIALGFVILAISYGVLASLPGEARWMWMVWIQVAAIAILVFGLRGIYYALLEENKVPIVLTGTAVGVVSTIGYTPDIFAFPVVGFFLDRFGIATGYQYYFTLLAAGAVLGLVLTLTLGWLDHRRQVIGNTTKTA